MVGRQGFRVKINNMIAGKKILVEGYWLAVIFSAALFLQGLIAGFWESMDMQFHSTYLVIDFWFGIGIFFIVMGFLTYFIRQIVIGFKSLLVNIISFIFLLMIFLYGFYFTYILSSL